ncbi:peptidoglycan-binding domain-containing protein [Actinomyces minihominis]|uniref:peptidoglycan-binding domain-containing protein n=1 Tax=Actinomyces minihominis TaxID=2002838 RepID=UPI00101AD5F7|nr:peptidoglycan-binding domain-containing protein [Actinomyces minihominis]
MSEPSGSRSAPTLQRTSSGRRRAWIWTGVCFGAIALVVGTWLLATRFQSPAQQEAAATPPEPGPVVVEVTRGDLVNRTTVMAAAVRESVQGTDLPLGANTSVVTAAAAQIGQQLMPGDVVVWVNDRPIFALEGVFPLYRSMVEGDSGKDVEILQSALSARGYGVVVDGQFGAATTSALTELYRSVGRSVPTTVEASEEVTEDEAEPGPARVLVTAPMDDFVVFRALPRNLVSIPAVGTVLTDENAVVDVAGEQSVLSTQVPGRISAGLEPGLPGVARLGGAELNVKVETLHTGSVSEQAEGEQNTTVTLSPAGGELPADWVGHEDIVVELDLQPPLMDVLLVPARAIATDSLGTSNVLLEQGAGSFEVVPVVELECIAGMCAIEDGSGVVAGSRLRVDR